MTVAAQHFAASHRRHPLVGAALLGFALGGFFDGILLHQLLQWHHMLSALEGERWADLRMQVLADGALHALMYLLAALGLWLLLRARSQLVAPGLGHRLLATALFGFAAWHLIDAVLAHWVLGLHRIRMDVPNPLTWDLGWLAIFGGGPALLGAWLLRRVRQGIEAQRRRRGRGTALGLTLAALLAGAWALRAPEAPQRTITLLLAPGVPASAAWGTAAGLDARLLWANAAGNVWVLALPEGPRRPEPALRYEARVLAVTGVAAAAACIGWSGAAVPAAASGAVL